MATLGQRFWDVLRGLPALSPLGLLLALRRPRGLHLFLADSWRSYRHQSGKRLPAITPWELLDFKGEAGLRLGENGIFAATEPNFLVMQLVAMLRPQKIFEIGTSQGRTTALVAMNSPPSTHIDTLDLSPEEAMPDEATDAHLIELAKHKLGIAFRDTNWSRRITQLLGNSATFDFAPYHDAIDLVLVDGSHSYPFVRKDSANAFRMIRPGGVILWHDYESMRSEYGVTRFVDDLRRVHGIPTYRLGRDESDTRMAVLRADDATKKRLIEIAAKAG